MKKQEYTISPAELKVLNVLWETSPLSAGEVVERLLTNEVWHSRTIKTLINRLVKKNILGYEEDGNRFLYYPLLKKDDYQQRMSKHFIHRVFGGRISPLIAHFAKEEKISKEDIKELKAILEDLESND